MNSRTYRKMAFVFLGGISLLEGCGRSPAEIRSLLSFQDGWKTAKGENPYLANKAHEVAVRLDSLRQDEIFQVLAKNKIKDVTALLEYESHSWDFKGMYIVFVVTRHSAYRIRIFDHGRDVAQLIIPETETPEMGACIEAVRDGYRGDQIMGGDDVGLVFMTVYRDEKPAAMFFKYKPILDVKRRLVKSGTQQVQAFSRLCEILFLAPTGKAVSEATDLKYPVLGGEHAK